MGRMISIHLDNDVASNKWRTYTQSKLYIARTTGSGREFCLIKALLWYVYRAGKFYAGWTYTDVVTE